MLLIPLFNTSQLLLNLSNYKTLKTSSVTPTNYGHNTEHRKLFTLIGFFSNPTAVNLEVSLTSDGFPKRASTNLAVTPILFLAKYTPAATRDIPVACIK